MKNPAYIIGIDPDVDKSGVALLEVATRNIIAESMTFVQLTKYFYHIADSFQRDMVDIVVEASWTTAHNFHSLPTDSKAVAAKKSYHVGCNHQVGKCICDMAMAHGLNVVEQPPLRKIWRGKDRKITHEELIAITGMTAKRTNQEVRDAVLLAWHHSGLPIQLKF